MNGEFVVPKKKGCVFAVRPEIVALLRCPLLPLHNRLIDTMESDLQRNQGPLRKWQSARGDAPRAMRAGDSLMVDFTIKVN